MLRTSLFTLALLFIHLAHSQNATLRLADNSEMKLTVQAISEDLLFYKDNEATKTIPIKDIKSFVFHEETPASHFFRHDLISIMIEPQIQNALNSYFTNGGNIVFDFPSEYLSNRPEADNVSFTLRLGTTLNETIHLDMKSRISDTGNPILEFSNIRYESANIDLNPLFNLVSNKAISETKGETAKAYRTMFRNKLEIFVKSQISVLY